jgi:signal transduction histidine kinase
MFFMGIALLLPLSKTQGQETIIIDPDFHQLITEARAYKNQDKMDLALKALEEASDWAEANEDDRAAIQTQNMFAEVYLIRGEVDRARSSSIQAQNLLQDNTYNEGLAYYLLVEAQLALLSEQELNMTALRSVREAKKTNNSRNLLNRAALLEGRIFERMGRPDSAIVRYNSLRGDNSDPYEKDYLSSAAHLSLAKLYDSQEKVAEAIINAESALEIAKTNEFRREYAGSNQLLAELYKQTGQYQKALAAVENMVFLRDSIYTIKKLELESEVSEGVFARQAIEQQQKYEADIAELSESASRSEITAILTSAFLTIISLLAVSLYRNNQIKLKTNDLLQTKNRELQLARDAAVQAMEAKTNFLSTVSHELRTPLYAVTGLTHLLLEENPRKNQLEHLKALKFSGDYLLNFINDILQINKIDADKLEPLVVECNLKKVLTDVISGLQQSAKDHKNEIILDYDPQIPSHLMSDPVKLSQVFMNLVGNALKFTREGEVVVIAKLLQREGDHANIYFEVRDNGIGIDKERQATIFDSFEQGSIQINREYGGTGLGLTIVKSLLGLFGSKIQLESEPGKGSSFFFELRMKCKDELIDDIPFEISPKDYQYAGLHLLVVEDNKINQVITKKMLSKKEITCDIASNGTEAVELAGKNTYDGILMDIHMPGISGVEATEQIRTFDQQTPIIALTAISLDDSLETFYAAGCNDVVTKPFKPEVFYEKIGENIIEPRMRKSYT